jgi:hypothetical protein
MSVCTDTCFNALTLNSPPGRGNAGKVTIDVIGAIRIIGDKDTFQSGISTRTAPETIGNGGNIKVSAGALSIESNGIGAGIFANFAGNGNAGNIDVDVDGLLKLSEFRASLSNVIDFGVQGNAGNINVNSGSIEMTDFSQIAATYAGIGIGRAGDISIRVDGQILLDGSNIQSIKGPDVIGRSGDVDLSASSLTICKDSGVGDLKKSGRWVK